MAKSTVTLLLLLFHPVKIDVFTWSTNQQRIPRDPMHSRAILFPSPLDGGSLQPFCGLFAVFCKEHGGRKFHLVHGHRVHSPLDRELDAPCRSRGIEPEEWIELVFSIFACNTRFPDRKLLQLFRGRETWKSLPQSREEANNRGRSRFY